MSSDTITTQGAQAPPETASKEAPKCRFCGLWMTASVLEVYPKCDNRLVPQCDFCNKRHRTRDERDKWGEDGHVAEPVGQPIPPQGGSGTAPPQGQPTIRPVPPGQETKVDDAKKPGVAAGSLLDALSTIAKSMAERGPSEERVLRATVVTETGVIEIWGRRGSRFSTTARL